VPIVAECPCKDLFLFSAGYVADWGALGGVWVGLNHSHSMINCNSKALIFRFNFHQPIPQYRPQYRQILTLLKRLQQCSRCPGMHTFDCIVSVSAFAALNRLDVRRPIGGSSLRI
jgi:hypothetical protein